MPSSQPDTCLYACRARAWAQKTSSDSQALGPANARIEWAIKATQFWGSVHYSPGSLSTCFEPTDVEGYGLLATPTRFAHPYALLCLCCAQQIQRFSSRWASTERSMQASHQVADEREKHTSVRKPWLLLGHEC